MLGFLNLFKPAGPTSTQFGARLRRMYATADGTKLAVGHMLSLIHIFVFCDYFAGWFVFVEGTRGASVCVCGCCRCGGVFVARGYADRSLYAAVSVSRDEGVLKQQRMARIDHELQRAVAKIISEELKRCV